MTEVFKKVYPQYMLFGMSYDDFWHGDPELVIYARQYYLLKQQTDNYNMWLNGVYTYKALTSTLESAFYALNKRKGKKPDGYYKEPLDILPKTEEQKQAEIEKARRQFVERMNAFKASWDAAHNKGGGSNA